ncbi:MAG: DUF885 domain-containing protein [Parvularculaceae bacterium]
MLKHGLIIGAAFLALAACSRGPEKPKAPPGPDAAAELKRIADAFLDESIKANPLVVEFAGMSDVVAPDYASMPDISIESARRFEVAEDALLADLVKIDPTALADRGDWVTYQALKETMESDQGLRICQQAKWSLNHMFGWQNALSSIAEGQPVETPDHRAAAISRWSKLPLFIAQDRANLEAGLADGYSAPKRVVARVVAQLDALIATPFDGHPLMQFVAKSDDADFKARMQGLYDADILPALVAYRDYVRDAYMPNARDALSISALPKGAECYDAMLRAYHSAKIGAKKTFDRGEATVAANKAAVIERGQQMFGETDFQAILARVKAIPENRFASEEELIDFTRALEPVARAKVAQFFRKLPDQPLVVEPFPDYLKGTGQSSRYEQKPEAEGPATYRINTDDWKEQTRGEAEIVLVHEGWPGHHLQIATARGVGGLHPATRLASSTAYIEGWARYAEALAEEAGVYTNGYGEINRRAWPARGMVVDPGLHLYGWTNEQAKAFLIEAGRFNETTANVALDRIAVIPGQLTAYDTGGLEIMALRKEAEERLGDAFDIREFHDRVLENGALPLGALREHVEAWIGETEKNAR